ncbi:MAG: response regulator [Candidatus Cloacimonadales bacterium]|jgi:DNA-binding response OmpR family regulator|nr:response regulator [Candidatus Cloacimonadales bacterium]HQB40881.1 response regulator [Candidatus Cloacimonadota bacterium]
MKDTTLLVEDDETLCELCTEMFKIMNSPLFTANTKEEAVKIFDEHKKKIGLVIFDMNLENVTGIEVHEALRQKGEYFTAILASGMFLEDDHDTYKTMGFEEIILKPFNLSELKRLINTYLVKKQESK